MNVSATATLNFERIGLDRARELIANGNTLLLDVRDARSFAAAHIASALHITRDNLDRVILGTPRHTPVLIYCYHGNASQSYAQMFGDFGFREVYSMDGGYEAWRQATAHARIQTLQSLQPWLTRHGFDTQEVNSTVGHYMTPLMHASREGDHAVVTALLEIGADVRARNADGNTALWHACLAGDPAIIELLVNAGADIDHRNDYGVTCLMCAVLRRKASVVQQLLIAGASVAPRTRDGQSLLDLGTSVECGDLLRAALSQMQQGLS